VRYHLISSSSLSYRDLRISYGRLLVQNRFPTSVRTGNIFGISSQNGDINGLSDVKLPVLKGKTAALGPLIRSGRTFPPAGPSWRRAPGVPSSPPAAPQARRSRPPPAPEQSSPTHPLLWWGMKPTVFGIHQLDEPPWPHSAEEGAFDASGSRY
jgi:hypothetical protein